MLFKFQDALMALWNKQLQPYTHLSIGYVQIQTIIIIYMEFFPSLSCFHSVSTCNVSMRVYSHMPCDTVFPTFFDFPLL